MMRHIDHIDLSAVLRDTVSCDLYSNLVTRPTGAAVRAQIEALLRDSGPALAVIDFTHVRMIDFSCADEVVAKLLLRYCDDLPPREAYFIFRGVSDAHWDAIEVVLEQRGLALLVEEEHGLELRGALTDKERRAWEVVRSRGCTAPADVADEIGGDDSDAKQLLEALHRRRLVMAVDGGYAVVGAHAGRTDARE
ncbi:MAG: hypothetical protein ABR499_11640 [Gemmatimonadaceae bacterium]